MNHKEIYDLNILSESLISNDETFQQACDDDLMRRLALDDVFRKIGQVYNADIVVMDKDLAKHMYRATFQGETLDEILRLMKLTVPMKYIEKTSEKAMPNGVYSKRYIEVVRL